MLVTIREVKRCRNGAYGNFLLRGKNSILVTLSMRLNTTLAEYAATLLHELLHLWVTLIRLKGFRTTNKREHDFIYAVERIIVRKMRAHMGEKK